MPVLSQHHAVFLPVVSQKTMKPGGMGPQLHFQYHFVYSKYLISSHLFWSQPVKFYKKPAGSLVRMALNLKIDLDGVNTPLGLKHPPTSTVPLPAPLGLPDSLSAVFSGFHREGLQELFSASFRSVLWVFFGAIACGTVP